MSLVSHEIVLVVVLVLVLECGLYLPKKPEDENDDEDDYAVFILAGAPADAFEKQITLPFA